MKGVPSPYPDRGRGNTGRDRNRLDRNLLSPVSLSTSLPTFYRDVCVLTETERRSRLQANRRRVSD